MAGMSLLLFACSGSAQVTVSTSNQAGTVNVWPFTPTYVVDQADSVINGLVPTQAPGNWSLELAGRNVDSLTLNTNLTVAIDPVTTSCSTNYVTYGNQNGAGSLLVYTLPTGLGNGYNITNITVYGGWANNGRDQQAYAVLYSTVANPTEFNYLAYVNDNPSIAGNAASSIQAVINNASGGPIANNVAALEFVLNWPGVENGYCGLAAITVGGTAAPSVVTPAVSITYSNENGTSPFTPSWTAETPNLISGLSPISSPGNFNADGNEGALSVLTDGTIGISGTPSTMASCGYYGGNSLIYALPANANGYDVTNIVVYSGWGDTGRDGQYYYLSYSTLANPNLYIPITTVFDWPANLGVGGGGGSAQANRVAIAMNNGSRLAGGVANLKFDFSSPPNASGFNNGWQGYSEIIVQGQGSATPPPPPSALLSQDILPASVTTVTGDQVIFSATFSNSPPVATQWQQITSAHVTNNINTGVVNVTNNGVITSTLTLNNVQVGSSGTYQLEGLNATNGAAAPSFSSGAPLLVTAVPAPINNVIISDANQTGQGAITLVNASTNFYPTWTENTNNDLILGSTDGGPSVPGTVYAGLGNFALPGSACNGDPAILSDGSPGYASYYPGVGGNQTMDSCGVYSTVPNANYAGISVTYTLPSSTTGWSLTNITVYGGWGDGGRDEQKYEVLYSTVAAPTSFIPLTSWVDYLPANPNNQPSATRTTLTAATGVLAKNVYAVEISFNDQAQPPESDWEGYSEIVVAGGVSPNVPVLTQDVAPSTAQDVVGSSLTLTAGFSNATSYQWLKNGTNVPGATSPTLTLSNLKLTDAATNGGYLLVAYNSAGSNLTSACNVYVDPSPTPTNNVVMSVAYQTSGSVGFGPTWDTSALGLSLVSGENPPSGGYDPTGDFTGGNDDASGLSVLTDDSYGVFSNDGKHTAFAAAGDGAGEYVIYSLGPNANGYNVTNVQIAGGWNDNGRNSQFYTVTYATVANPTMYFPMAAVANDLSTANILGGGDGEAVPSGGGVPTTVRTTFTPASGVLASNVGAIFVDFQYPGGVPNGYSGYSEISVFGTPATTAPVAGPVITTAHEETNNIWTPETPNLIANQLPSSFGPGVFTGEGCNETNMTDGILGFGNLYSTSCGDDTNNSVSYIVFSATNSTGWNLTNIVVYTLWHDYGRDGQYYNLSYSKESAPNTFLQLASVAYNPFVPHDGRATGNRVQIAPPLGQSLLASNVAAVKFDFTSQGTEDYSWSGYTQIILQGTNLPAAIVPTLPTLAQPRISGGNLILTGTGGTPVGYSYTLLTTTNLLAPNWTVYTTGTLGAMGSISNSIPVTSTPPARFFKLRMP